MLERDRLQNAIKLIVQGHCNEAVAELLMLDLIITDKNLRMHMIDAALSVLDPIDYNDKLIELSSEGIEIAGEFNIKEMQAFFMSRKADFLMTSLTFVHYNKDCLKLCPEWIEFSTEEDQNNHEQLTYEAKKIERNINDLLFDAAMLADQSGDQHAVARVLIASAGIESSYYVYYKGEYMRRGSFTKLWLKVGFMRLPFFQRLFVSSKNENDTLNNFVTSFTDKLLKAARILEKLDDPLIGYAYHNLSNDLKSAYRFQKSKKYLLKARVSAMKYDDKLLIKKVELMEKSIKKRNRDIPNYISGEKREI